MNELTIVVWASGYHAREIATKRHKTLKKSDCSLAQWGVILAANLGTSMWRPLLMMFAGILILVTGQSMAQNGGVRYPTSFQPTKDGTAVLLEDYASAPQSTPKFDGAAPPNDFEGLPYQLARLNVLISEPA